MLSTKGVQMMCPLQSSCSQVTSCDNPVSSLASTSCSSAPEIEGRALGSSNASDLKPSSPRVAALSPTVWGQLSSSCPNFHFIGTIVSPRQPKSPLQVPAPAAGNLNNCCCHCCCCSYCPTCPFHLPQNLKP